MHHCGRACSCIYDTCVRCGCAHDGNTSASVFVAGCFKHVAKVYVAETSWNLIFAITD